MGTFGTGAAGFASHSHGAAQVPRRLRSKLIVLLKRKAYQEPLFATSKAIVSIVKKPLCPLWLNIAGAEGAILPRYGFDTWSSELFILYRNYTPPSPAFVFACCSKHPVV